MQFNLYSSKISMFASQKPEQKCKKYHSFLNIFSFQICLQCSFLLMVYNSSVFTFFFPVSKTVNLSIIQPLSSGPYPYRLILSWLQSSIAILIFSVSWRPYARSVQWCSRVFNRLKVPSVIRLGIMGRFLIFWKSSRVRTAKMISDLDLKSIRCIFAGIRFGLWPIRPYLLRFS